jgi:hypothetical protein
MIKLTRQAFIDYHTPILNAAFAGDPEAQGIIRAMLLEAYELDPQITNLKAILHDCRQVLQQAHSVTFDKLVAEVHNPISLLLARLEAMPVQPGPDECAQAKGNRAHRCFNQCYVCRFPANREPKTISNAAG